MDKYEIGKKLKGIRIERNISQEMVADYLGTTCQKVSSFETGRTRVDLETFILLCSYYRISADSFFNVTAPGSLSASEQALLECYRSLNDSGKKAMEDYAQLLSSSEQYTKKKGNTRAG